MGAPGTTPGPWAVCGLISGPVYVGAERPGNPARMDDVLSDGPNMLANANQAAASGALYDALNIARNQVVGFMIECGHSPEIAVANVKQIDAALALARGEAQS